MESSKKKSQQNPDIMLIAYMSLNLHNICCHQQFLQNLLYQIW